MATIEKLEARLDGIGHLLADRYIVVPPYQRAYSWTEEQVEELLRDLSDAIRQKDAEYFLGTLVLTKHEGSQDAVIDGQQRLATISILICAIRNYFVGTGDNERADELHRTYLARKELRGLTETPHLTLMPADNAYYADSIIAKDISRSANTTVDRRHQTASSLRLETALRLCSAHVSAIAKQTNSPAELLLDWLDYLHEKAKVIVVVVNDEGAAYTIFEVLNDRGLELSVSDLLKNFIFRIAGDKVDEAQVHWANMTSILDASGAEEKALKTFIRHFWASRNGVTREKDLYEKIRQHVTSKQHALGFAKELGQLARYYAALDNPSDDLWKEFGPSVRESVEALQTLKATQIRPLLLSIATKFEIKEVRRAFPMLVCWTVRFLIVGKLGSGPLESGYAERAKEVSKGAINTAVQLFDASQGFLATDDEFEEAFSTARVSVVYLARYYLRVLEAQQSSPRDSEMIINPREDSVTLEHIMPQTREPHWSCVTEDQHKSFVKRLGNMALLDKNLNEKCGNLPFTVKRKTLAASKIQLTRNISTMDSWGVSEIEKRQRVLAGIAVKAWPIRPRQ